MVLDCHGGLLLKAKVMKLHCISNLTPLFLHKKRTAQPKTPTLYSSPTSNVFWIFNNTTTPPSPLLKNLPSFYFLVLSAMRATLPSRFALALDARAPRRSLNGAPAPVPATTGPTGPLASSASVTSSGPIGQALLEKVGGGRGCH